MCIAVVNVMTPDTLCQAVSWALGVYTSSGDVEVMLASASLTDGAAETIISVYCTPEAGDWARKCVVPQLEKADQRVQTQGDLRDAFWDAWLKARQVVKSNQMIAYTVFPNTAAFLSKTISEGQRVPPRVLDVRSMALATGVKDDLSSYHQEGETICNAADNVRATARMWRNIAMGARWLRSN